MLLESKSKFNVQPVIAVHNRPVTADSFFKWSSNNMYRTSYTDMSFKVTN